VESNQQGIEKKFLKSKLNAGTEAKAHDFVLQDRRFQKPDNQTKKMILSLLDLDQGSWSSQSFDLIMSESPLGLRITPESAASHIDDITLVEVKSTRSTQVKDVRLNSFFYGSSKTQYDLAHAAGDRLVFVFVVLTDSNAYGKPFFVVAPFSEIERRTRTKRIQYQVNFRSDVPDQGRLRGPYPLQMD